METLLNGFLQDGSPAAWAIVFLGGILSVGTPCVLPMVPITLSVLGVTNAGTRMRAATITLAYVGGIILCFTCLGLFSAATGALFGSLLAHPLTAAGLAAIFLVLAAGSFELFHLSELTWITSRLPAPTGPRRHALAFAAGLVAGFVAVPCIGPVLLGILTYAASMRSPFAGTALLAAYAAGFSLPFLLFGVFQVKVPKRGAWMRTVKSIFGIVLIAMAHWFLRGAFPVLREPFPLAVGVCLLLAGALIGALHLHFDGTRADRVRKSAGILAMALGTAFVLNASMRSDLDGWCAESEDGTCVALACDRKEPTVVDFGAEWCTACKEMEHVTFRDAEVETRLRKFGRVRVDVDVANAIAERYKIQGVPTVVILDEHCQERTRVVGKVSPPEFLEALHAL